MRPAALLIAAGVALVALVAALSVDRVANARQATEARAIAPVVAPQAPPLAPALGGPVPQLQHSTRAQAAPRIVNDEFAETYALMVETARLSPAQDAQVRRILADVQVADQIEIGASTQWMIERGKPHHMALAGALAGRPEGQVHARKSERISEDAHVVSQEYNEQVIAAAELELAQVLAPEQLRMFRAVMTVGDVQLSHPFDLEP